MSKYYVYCHYYINERNEKHIFYVGKGCGNRAYRRTGKGRNNGVWDKIVEDLNYEYEIEIMKYFTNEKEAFKYEYELQQYYWNKNQCEANLDKGYEWRRKVSDSKKGKKWTEESKIKRRQTLINKGVWRTDEEIQREKEEKEQRKPFLNKGINNAMYGKPAPNRKKVIVIEKDGTRKEFECCKDVDTYYNIKQSRAWARGTSNHYHSKTGMYISKRFI